MVLDGLGSLIPRSNQPNSYGTISTCKPILLIEKATRTSRVFAELGTGGVGGAASALVAEPGTVIGALTDHPETSALLGAAETILEFKTKAARDIEAARIKSIIDARLADHVRREALKFVDEMQRAVQKNG